MTIGWIKLHRALSKHPIASDPHAISVWVHLMLLANFASSKKLVNGRMMEIGAGQLITSRKSLSEKTGVQESKVERVLKMLESEQQITQHGTSKFRVISIVNWEMYQGDEQQSEQQVNTKRTAGEQQVNTLEEGKKSKEKIKSPSAKSQEPDEAFDTFWRLYPKKVSKSDAVKAWVKIDAALIPAIMGSLAKHCGCEQWVKDDGKFIPNAATWLNKQKWEDEVRPYVQGAETGRKLSAVELVAARGAERERARQGTKPQYVEQGDFIEGEFSAG